LKGNSSLNVKKVGKRYKVSLIHLSDAPKAVDAAASGQSIENVLNTFW
jgi:hypothetical protein